MTSASDIILMCSSTYFIFKEDKKMFREQVFFFSLSLSSTSTREKNTSKKYSEWYIKIKTHSKTYPQQAECG